MKALVLILATLLILHTCESYILLTANMEDVHALAKQLAASPVVDQVKRLWRRASMQFQKKLKQTRRQGGKSVEEEHDGETEIDRRTRRIIRDLVAIGKESGYIEPIKQVLQKFSKK
ncbi:uncharacterized protein LOC123876134 [Maniola jurtina]|uniref:uncharacterized protein LOC123876134 n=1 Tax=Maniola jurtina TaxID=191418 RepID=UPI001E6896D7|nr:uncharacterized protein LOC123876134 [Maniola jurtina]